MILLLLAGPAVADPAWDRLFGPEPAPEATVEAPAPPELPPWAIPATVSGLGVCAVAWMRRSKPVSPGTELKILTRQSLGDKGALVLVEVSVGDGERRRLLIGTGSGSPTLVADLGGRFDLGVEEAPRTAPPTLVEVTEERGPARNIAEEFLAERRSGGGRVWAVVGEDE